MTELATKHSLLAPPDKPFEQWTVDEAQQYEDTLVEMFVEAKGAQVAAKLAYEDAEEDFRQLEQALWDYMDARGMRSLNRAEGVFQKKATLYPSFPAEGHAAFMAWVHEQGLENEFLVVAVNRSPVNDLIKKLVHEGAELPPGIPAQEPRRNVSYTRR